MFGHALELRANRSAFQQLRFGHQIDFRFNANARGDRGHNAIAHRGRVARDFDVVADPEAEFLQLLLRADHLEERVFRLVCDRLGVNKEQVTRQTAFVEDIGADSLDIVELVMGLEEEFGVNIPDDQAEKIKTVGEAIDYIEREKAKQ